MGKPNNITNNFVWSLAEKAGRYGITLLTTIILARILQPKEFGVIAIVTVFITIANVFVQNGFGFAVIQRKNATNKDFTFILFFNFIVSSTFLPMYNMRLGEMGDKFGHMFAYALYGIICVAAALFVWKLVPETKGKTLEDMTKLWKKKK